MGLPSSKMASLTIFNRWGLASAGTVPCVQAQRTGDEQVNGLFLNQSWLCAKTYDSPPMIN